MPAIIIFYVLLSTLYIYSNWQFPGTTYYHYPTNLFTSSYLILHRASPSSETRERRVSVVRHMTCPIRLDVPRALLDVKRRRGEIVPVRRTRRGARVRRAVTAPLATRSAGDRRIIVTNGNATRRKGGEGIRLAEKNLLRVRREV